jgi:TonB family protein
MASRRQFGGRGLSSIFGALVCLLGLPYACAQSERTQQFTVLNGKEAHALLLSQVPPEYPAVAKLNYLQGQVRLRLVVSSEGTVSRAHALEGNPLLAAAALSSAYRWRYRPFVTEGAPAPFTTFVDITFALRSMTLKLSPEQADSDFSRQIKPPEVLTGPEKDASTRSLVCLRVLVNEEGKAIDSVDTNGVPTDFEAVMKTIERWSFRPARWGTLSVPWYLEVEVPVRNFPVRADARMTGDLETSGQNGRASRETFPRRAIPR